MANGVAKTVAKQIEKAKEKLIEIISQYLNVNNPSAD